MSIPWKAIQRRNPRDPNAPAKYYGMDVTRSVLDTDDVAAELSARSGVTEGDVLSVLRTLTNWLPVTLGNGDAVSLDRLGTFSASLTSEGGAESPEALSRLPRDVGVNFRPSPDLRSALQGAGDHFTGEVTTLTP